MGRWAGILATAALCAGCGQFGLPTGRTDGSIQLGDPTILDVDPKVASRGTLGLTVEVVGIDTSFDTTTEVDLPLLPQVAVADVEVLSVERLTAVLDIPADAELGTSPVEITSDRDGVLVFEPGFTVVP